MTKALQPDDLIAHYRVIRALGAGGMGEVYLARDSTLDRDVALKVLPHMAQADERIRRFVLEAKSASSLSHPHIITVYEIGCETVFSGGKPRAEQVNYIAMELVDGDALADIIHEHKADLKTLLGYLAQAADGLAKAHASGIVHRDLKPGNIMVSKDGYAKVLDFGLAKLVEKETAPDATIDAATKQQLTMEGMIVGTIGYMPPEQILGRPIDHRADIFSFGCILYEGITRRRPFNADSQFEALQKIVHEHPTPIESFVPDAPMDLRHLVARCLAKLPEERIPSMKDVASELRRISNTYEVLSRSASSATDQTMFFPSPSGAIPPSSGSGMPPSGYPSAPGMPPSYAGAQAATLPSGMAVPQGIGAPTSVAIPVEKKKLPMAAIGGIAIVLLAVIGVAIWKFGLSGAGGGGGLSEDAINAMDISSVLSSEVLQSTAVSPEGKFAAYVSLINGSKYQLQIRQLSATKPIEVVPAQDLAILGVSFTPDGERLWYCMFDKENKLYSSLYEVPSLGGDPKRKVSDADTEPTFSKDGKQIAFVRGLPAERKASLIIAQEDGSGAKTVATLPAPLDNSLRNPRWSPDGTKIAVVYVPEQRKPNLVVFEAKEGGAQQPVGAWEGPSIDSLAWMSDTGLVVAGAAATGPNQLWYVSYPGGQRRRLTNDISNYAFVTASSDGKTIAARRTQRTVEVWEVPVAGTPSDMKQRTQGKENIVGIAPASGGTVTFSAPHEGLMQLWSLKPDGSRSSISPKGATVLSSRVLRNQNASVFTAYGADLIGHVHRVDVDGNNPKPLTTGSGEVLVDVTPDGKYILYNTPQEPGKLQILASDGSGTSRTLATDYIEDRGLIFSRDGKLVSYNRLDTSQSQVGSVRTVRSIETGATIATVPSRAGYQFTPDGALSYIEPAKSATEKTPAVPAAVFKVATGGGVPLKLFDVPDARVDRVYWPDDKTAVVSAFSFKSVVHNLWRWSVGSAKPVPLTDFRSGLIFEAAASEDLKTMYFLQGSNNRDIIKITGLVK